MIMPWHIYQEAEADGVDVHFLSMEEQASISVPGHIAIDKRKLPTTAEEATAAAHELGHVNTGSFYDIHSKYANRRKCENRADRAAIRRHIDKDELMGLLKRGITQPWELAEHFGFTEDFIKKAVCLYTHGNLATESYFELSPNP